jgi:hypothetical protein
VLPIIGTILMLTVPRSDHNKGVLLFGYYLVSCSLRCGHQCCRSHISELIENR